MTTKKKELITPTEASDDIEASWKLITPRNTGGHGHIRHLKGKVFAHLEVLERAGSNKHGMSLWQCRCQLCGNLKVISRAALLSERVKSCGCLKESLKGKPKPKPAPLRDPNARPRQTRWSRLLKDEG